MKQCDLCGAEMDAGSRDRAHDNPYRCLRELQARAERAEAEAAELRAQLDAATVVPINGVLYRVLPGAVGYTGDSSAGRRKPDDGKE